MFDKIHVILPNIIKRLSGLGWYKGVMLAAVVLALPLCLSGSCNVSISFSGQSAQAATGQDANKNYRVIADMGAKEKAEYAGRLRKHIARDSGFLMKLTGQDMDLLFDAPDLVRRDGEVVSRHYKTDDCLMDVYFQAPDNEQFATVVHYEFRQRKTASLNLGLGNGGTVETALTDNETCLQGLVALGQDYVVASR